MTKQSEPQQTYLSVGSSVGLLFSCVSPVPDKHKDDVLVCVSSQFSILRAFPLLSSPTCHSLVLAPALRILRACFRESAAVIKLPEHRQLVRKLAL